MKDLTPDVGSDELCATIAHASVVAKRYVLWPKERKTRESGDMMGKRKLGKCPMEES